ncbi:hypothetical protein HPB48_009157 [Haemaphysalis longicornis]|uniref:Uncharacterized protein n=1 Tax=Haemaphysalis longicornis TaxID=44386 RepID=A0A9J6GDT3_HAELO|nr:hypothetical protein HPB48_009157 [Haemaphysalis longicornis]
MTFAIHKRQAEGDPQEVLCNEHQCPHQATVAELKRKLDLQQKKTRKLGQQVESVLDSKLHHLAPDQVLSVTNSDARGNRRSNKTVQKALQVRLACGSRGYDFLKDGVIPLPSERNLQRRIEEVKSEPGVSMDGGFLKVLIFSVIEKCEAGGCHVDVAISDMGPSYKALWKQCGISAKRSREPVVSCRRPCAADTDRQLFFLADEPHVLKSIRGHLVRQQSIFLPDDIVSKYSLPTNENIKELAKKDAKHDRKLPPHLKPSHLELNHYDNMDVSSAVAVLNHSVGAAMRVLVCLGQLEERAITLAWFVEQVFKWFSLLTPRYIGTAMSHFKPQAHQEAVTFLEEFASMFARVTIRKGSPVQACANWCPDHHDECPEDSAPSFERVHV